MNRQTKGNNMATNTLAQTQYNQLQTNINNNDRTAFYINLVG